MFYANNIRGFLSSRKELYISRFYLWGHARIDPPKILKNKNTFCQVSVYTKANDGKKEIGSTYSFIVVCCQYWLSRVRPDRISHPRLASSLSQELYWASVTRDIDIAIIVIQLCQQSTLSASEHYPHYYICFCSSLRGASTLQSLNMSQFKIEFVSRACCSTSRCTFSWRNVY